MNAHMRLSARRGERGLEHLGETVAHLLRLYAPSRGEHARRIELLTQRVACSR